jgi:prevent-host-death family protein
LVKNMTMFKVNIHEAKARLSEFVDAVERGERVVICRRNRPVAELRPAAAIRTTPRPLGAASPLDLPPSFFEPLPTDFLDAFGQSGPASIDDAGKPGRGSRQRALAVAERPDAPYGGRKGRRPK